MSKEFTVNKPDISHTSIKQRVATFIAFIFFTFGLPWLIILYINVRIARRLWLKLLRNRFPHLDFVEETTMRTLLDNHRNQGVINVLLTVNGPCQPLQIHKALVDNIVEKRNARGRLLHPKLRALLVSCWGNYAWKSPAYFNLENHLIIGNTNFKGRQLNDNNIQEYVSDIISKYLPTHQSPWQIVVIPNILSEDQKYFILVRVHHLLIADSELLNLGDLLLLKKENESTIEHVLPPTEESFMKINSILSPLLNIVKQPKAISKLYGLICENSSNKWNEFISIYDPMESPKSMTPSGSNLSQLFAVFLIVAVQLLKDYINTWTAKKLSSPENGKFYFSIFKKEITRRGITTEIIFKSIFEMLIIVFWFPNTVYFIYRSTKHFFITVPKFFFYEFLAFKTNERNTLYPNTYVTFIYNYMPLLKTALSELKYCCKIIYKTPMSLIKEIIFHDDNLEPHQLQTESLCGRKIVAWSEPIPRKSITDIASAAGVTETEILLILTKNCLESYFFLSGIEMPDKVLLTARTISCEVLFTSSDLESSSGVLCLGLPMSNFNNESIVEEILKVKQEVEQVQRNQVSIFLIGSKRAFLIEALPSVVARLALNYWFRKFSVLLTEIVDTTDGKIQETEWGHRVTSFLSWMPPQGNMSMSLTLQRYGDSVRLGVMTDARLLPNHVNVVCNWKEAADRLITHFHLLEAD